MWAFGGSKNQLNMIRRNLVSGDRTGVGHGGWFKISDS